MPPNYYALLTIPETATLHEIKAAYRQRMKEVHPDLASRDSTPEKQRREALAKQINEAYAVLSDPTARRRYDRLRKNGGRSPLMWQMVRGLLKVSFTGLDWLMGKRNSKGTKHR